MSDSEVIAKFNEMDLNTRTDMLSKEVAWIPDSNGASYNGQIVFDLSSLGQTNKWISYSEAFIEIPYVIAMQSDKDITAAVTKNTIGFKDGFYQCIDNIAVEFNQKTAVQVQNFTNIHTQFKMLTSSSVNDLFKNAATIGFFGDSAEMVYYSTANANGIGYVNNTNTTYIQRKTQTTAFDASGVNSLPTIINAEAINSGRSYYSNNGVAAAGRIYYWVVMATIRLSDITDFFSKVPLCKTTDIRLIITYNSSQCTITDTYAAGPPATNSYSIASYQQISGHICPFMFNVLSLTETANITIRSNVMRSGLGDNPVTSINNCRLYVPIYKVNDAVSLSMIKNMPLTKIEYNDIYSYVVPEVTAGASFVHTLSTGIVDAQYVVVIPFPKTNSLAGLGVATYQSPFDSAPGTSSAITLRDFNVQIAGLNVFQANERYDFEQFCNELSKINAINGNNTLGLTSGILSLYLFQQAYRMYVADVSRREPSQDNVVKSIVINGVNATNISIELICFVAYRKEVLIDTATGSIRE